MRRVIFAILLLCYSVPGLAQEWLVSKPSRPHLAADMAQSVIAEVYQRLNVAVRFETIPLARSLYMLDRGELDADLYRATPGITEYPNVVPVRIPIAVDDAVAFGVGQVLKVNGWRSLQPYRLVTVRGMKEVEELGPEYYVEFVNLSDQAFRMVDAGRADLAIFTRGAACTPHMLGLNRLRIQEPAIEKLYFYHHVHASHAEWVPRMEAELTRMQKDGSLQRLQDEARKRWQTCQR